MWRAYNTNLSFAEGDFGIPVQATVKDIVMSASDILRFTFKKKQNGETVLVKNYATTTNSVFLELTAEESSLFTAGKYVYSADLYDSNGMFLCNVVPVGELKVEGKA